MRFFTLLSTCALAVVLSAAGQGPTTEPTLLFRSGFDAGTEISSQSASWADLRGVNESLGTVTDWRQGFGQGPLGSFRIQYGGGDPDHRLASLVADPDDAANRVLRYWMREVNQDRGASYGGKGRIQATIAGNRELHRIYYRVRMRLGPGWQHLKDADESMGWLILSEFWNNANWTKEGHPFRIHTTISNAKERGDGLYLSVGAQTASGRTWETVWHETADEFAIPVGQWLTLECYLKEGDAGTGRYFLAVTPEGGDRRVLFNVRDWTHHPEDPDPDGFVQFQPLKLYTHKSNVDRVRARGGALQIDWDDFEIWSHREPEGLDRPPRGDR